MKIRSESNKERKQYSEEKRKGGNDEYLDRKKKICIGKILTSINWE